MIRRYLWLPLLGLLTIGLIACSQSSSAVPSTSPSTSSPTSTPSASAASNDLTQLFSRIWRVTAAPSQPASGSIYVFLPNGTLLETSCTETYRIATWTIDKQMPRVLRVVEDGQLAFTAAIDQLSSTTLRLQQTLAHGNEKRSLTLTAVEQEFACPDLPK